MTTKTYPRARVSRHPVLDGWTIDLLLRAGAKPIKVNATYATIEFAHKSALTKLGVKAPATGTTATRRPEPTLNPAKPEARQPKPAGLCIPCGRPMRPVGTKAAEYPGAVLRQRDGICQTCNKSQTRTVA